MPNTFQTVGITSFETSTLLAQSQKAFLHLLATCLGHHGLTVSEWSCLGQLYPNVSLRPTDLAHQLGVKNSFLALTLAKLEAKGYTIASPDIEDARSKQVELTPVGLALIERVEPLLMTCLNDQFAEISSNDLKTYFGTAAYIAAHVRHRD